MPEPAVEKIEGKKDLYTSFPELKPPETIPARTRITQDDILPGSLKARLFGNIIVLSSTVSASAALNNGDQAVFSLTTSIPNATINSRNITQPDITLYHGAVGATTPLPGGSAIDESLWQVIGPWNDFQDTDFFNTVSKIYVRNIAAGAAQTVNFRGRARSIANADAGTTT